MAAAVKFIVMADTVTPAFATADFVMAAHAVSKKWDIAMDGVTGTGVIGTASGIASASAIAGAIEFAGWNAFAARAGTSV